MRQFILCGLFAITSLLSFFGCSDDPSSVGRSFFEDPQTQSMSVGADSSATHRARISGTTPTLLLGMYQNYEARMLLQFGIPQGFADTLVASASLRLKPRYWFKDSTGTLAFTVHKILIPWDQFTITFADTNGLYDPVLRGGDSRPMSPGETLAVPIDTALVREWLRAGQSEGMLLKPTGASTVVYGFTSISNLTTDDRPQLIVRYHVPDSTMRLDSLVLPATQNAFVANAPPPPPSTAVTVIQAGVADRGLLRFDVSAIPRSASVTSASLTFVINRALSVRNELSVDSILIQILTLPDSLGGITARAQAPTENDSVFTADVRSIVQQWITGKPNYGIALRAFGEFSSLDRFAVHGTTSPDTASRPLLRITYSTFRKE